MTSKLICNLLSKHLTSESFQCVSEQISHYESYINEVYINKFQNINTEFKKKESIFRKIAKYMKWSKY